MDETRKWSEEALPGEAAQAQEEDHQKKSRATTMTSMTAAR